MSRCGATPSVDVEEGKLADLVVIDRDPFSVPLETIKDLKVVLTIVGGKIVYDGEPVN